MYQSLYRKYRPRVLSEIIGQPVATRIVLNSIKNNTFSHAYLFCGPRGTGKTSTAKILAKLVNCDNPDEYGNACGECKCCVSCGDNNCVDIIEIDAASNNGVDEIRDIKSRINLVPADLKYKVYIIDEVHMLSIGAFNALLKTLEEPPEHVIFILATTEIEKIPMTILSRCQLIEFKLVSISDIKLCLKNICDKENIKCTDDALAELSVEAEGSIRDAITLLDKARSFSNDDLVLDDVKQLCGKPNNETINNLVDLLFLDNYDAVVTEFNNIYNNGYDLLKVVEDIILNIKNGKAISNNCSILDDLIKLYDRMCTSNIKSIILLEVEMFKIMHNSKKSGKVVNERDVLSCTSEVVTTNKVVDLGFVDKISYDSKLTNEAEEKVLKLKQIRINNAFCGANKELLTTIKSMWNKLSDFAFDKTNGAYVCNLLDGIPVLASEKYIIIQLKSECNDMQYNSFSCEYEKILEDYLGLSQKICFVDEDLWNEKKKEYVDNIRNNVKYVFEDEVEISTENNAATAYEMADENSDLNQKINDLFK